MSATRIVWAREAAAACYAPATYLTLTTYLALSSGLFAASLQYGEDGSWSVAALWTLSAAIPLPLLAAMATMRLFAGERSDGTLSSLLTVPVRDRDILLGKFLAAMGTVLLGLAGAAMPWLLLQRALPGDVPPVSSLALPLALLALQAVSWTALGTFSSVLARRPWGAAVGALLAALGAMLVWGVCARFFPALRWRMPAFPLILECLEAAAGRLSIRSLVWHVSACWWLLFAATRLLEARRWH